jgi:hypothetical protein
MTEEAYWMLLRGAVSEVEPRRSNLKVNIVKLLKTEMTAKAGGDEATPTLMIRDTVLVGLDEDWVRKRRVMAGIW